MTGRKLHVDLSGTGSGWGISFWKSYWDCPLRAAKDAEARKQGMPTSSDSEATLTGTVMHALFELYFKGGFKNKNFDTSLVEYRQMPPWGKRTKSLEMGRKLFKVWRKKHAPNFFGDIEFVEKKLTLPMKDRPSWAPEKMPLTGQIDLGVNVLRSSAMAMSKQYRINARPGFYLVDHKSAKSWWPNMKVMYELEIQFPYYQMLYHACTGTKPKGMIVNVVTKESKKVHLFLQKYPDKKQQAMVLAFLQRAWFRYNEGTAKGDPTACFSYGKPCKYVDHCNRR